MINIREFPEEAMNKINTQVYSYKFSFLTQVSTPYNIQLTNILTNARSRNGYAATAILGVKITIESCYSIIPVTSAMYTKDVILELNYPASWGPQTSSSYGGAVVPMGALEQYAISGTTNVAFDVLDNTSIFSNAISNTFHSDTFNFSFVNLGGTLYTNADYFFIIANIEEVVVHV